MQVKRQDKNTTPRGPTRVCPICAAALSNAEMGVNAHLRAHIKNGLLKREDEQALRMRILNRSYPKATSSDIGGIK